MIQKIYKVQVCLHYYLFQYPYVSSLPKNDLLESALSHFGQLTFIAKSIKRRNNVFPLIIIIQSCWQKTAVMYPNSHSISCITRHCQREMVSPTLLRHLDLSEFTILSLHLDSHNISPKLYTITNFRPFFYNNSPILSSAAIKIIQLTNLKSSFHIHQMQGLQHTGRSVLHI